MRFDTRNIDFSKPESDVQRVEPDWVWVSPDDKAILPNFVKENGIVYFLSSNRDYNFGYGEAYLAAIDAETSVFKWKKALPHVFGFRRNSLVLNGDYLNVIDMVPSCYNKNTGESIYENEDRDMEHVYEVPLSAASYLKGITLYDNKLYYTNGMHSFASSHNPNIPKEFIKNVICVDALTGKLIWGNLVPRGGAIYTFPVVINGKAVIATDNGLRVNNALTGELLGVDKTINNWGDEVNYAYNDLFIFVDKDSSFLRSRLTAIRIDQGN
jgi:outer membrane protein assembly factor BamB